MSNMSTETFYAADIAIAPLEAPRARPGEVRFSYSKPEDSIWKKLIILGIESLTGKPKLERLYREWSASKPGPEDHIFKAGLRLLDIAIEVDSEALAATPKSGPLLIIANHPFGVVDGLSVMDLALRIRPDVKIMVHSLLCQPPEAQGYLLPVDFTGSAQAKITSADTRRRAVEWLAEGHCLVLFPAGSVATAQKPFRGRARDAAWHSFLGRLAKVSGLKILPVFFHGQNSRLFQLASHLHYALRVALLFRESARHIGRPVKATLGAVVDGAALPHEEGREAVTQELRRRTFSLGSLETEPAFIWPAHINCN